MEEIKFKVYRERKGETCMEGPFELIDFTGYQRFAYTKDPATGEIGYVDKVMQYTGIEDENEVEIYLGDILEFDNGDRIEICMEDWLEFYCEAIGEPQCEDQWRDLYRISKAKIIGNRFENPELLTTKEK